MVSTEQSQTCGDPSGDPARGSREPAPGTSLTELGRRLGVFKRQVSRWEQEIGVVDPDLDLGKITEILEADREKLADMTAVEVGTAAVMISQLGYLLQYRENRCRAFLQWSEWVRSALRGDDLQQLNGMIHQANQKLARMAFMTRRVENLAQSLASLQRAKEREQR